ncbi:MAG: siphovirus Gp157 family protein [Chitinispirillales bacterium]|jgi:hypothetical protein|nr:siphovirus Gp157 family protein [Chitinispirillales bacterium]
MKLYELKVQYDALMAHIEAHAAEHEGEIPDNLDAMMDNIEAEIEEKVFNCGLAYKNEMAEAEAYRAEEMRLAARRKTSERKAKWLKAYIDAHTPKEVKYKWPQLEISRRKTEAVDIVSATLIPDEYCRITREPSKSAIKAALKYGGGVPGAELVTRFNIQIK